MDTYCHRCGEPVDIDYFHDVAAEQETTFAVVRAAFQSKGCEALGEPKCDVVPSLRNDAVAMLNDLLGDDIDGIASMMDDFDHLGMLED